MSVQAAGTAVAADDAHVTQADRDIFRDRDFRLFWTGETSTLFAGNATGLALPLIAVTVLDSSALTLGFLAAAVWLPWLLIGLLAGAWVDRLSKRRVMIVCNLLSAGALIGVWVAWIMHVLTIGQLFATAFIIGGSSVFFISSYHAYFPTLVGKKHLLKGNARLQGTESVMYMVGPSGGGLIAQAFGAASAGLMNGGAYLLSAVCMTSIRKRESSDGQARRRDGLRAEIGEGLRFVLNDAYLRPFVVYGAAANLVLNGYQAIYVAFLTRTVGVSPQITGLLIAAGGLGGILGAMVVPPAARRFGTARGFLIAKFVITPFAILMPMTGPHQAILFFFFGLLLADGSITAGNITMNSFRQMYCPPHMLGRVVATTTFIKYSTLPVGAVLGGVVGSLLGLRATMWIMTGAFACCSAVLLWGPMRKVRDFPTEPPSGRAVEG